MAAKQSFEMVVKSIPSQIHVVEQELEKFGRKVGLSEDDIENFGIATTEMVNNAIRHGNKSDPSKTVSIKFSKSESEMRVVVRDDGGGFDPDAVADPLKPENIFRESGRGIFIVKMLMDDVQFKFTDAGTEVILIKKLS